MGGSSKLPGGKAQISLRTSLSRENDKRKLRRGILPEQSRGRSLWKEEKDISTAWQREERKNSLFYRQRGKIFTWELLRR